MKLVYTNENNVLVGLAKGMLENADIAVTIKNEFSSVGMGPGYSIWAELWVCADDDFEEAHDLLQSLSEPNDS